jgi:hypothetical protein
MPLPDANKLNINVGAKASLERRRLPPSDIIRLSVHLVRKRDLLLVAGREKAHFVDHTSKRTSGVSASTEAKDADAVSFIICEPLRMRIAFTARLGTRTHNSA